MLSYRLIAPAPDPVLRPTGVPIETVLQLAVWPVSMKDSFVAPFTGDYQAPAVVLTIQVCPILQLTIPLVGCVVC